MKVFPMLRLKLACLTLVAAFPAIAEPVTVQSCGRDLSVQSPPSRAVAHGSNLVEIMLALQLQDRMLGFTGSGPDSDAMFPALDGLRQLQRDGLTTEILLENDVDFLFAGWSYGMRVGGEVTPESLSTYGIPVYELSESCIRLGQERKPDFDVLFRDLTNLAALFEVPDRAADLIQRYQQRLEAIAAFVDGKEAPLVFVYDSGDKTPVTAGGFAMPQAIIEAAGGRNLAQDLDSSWVRIDWETVADRDPDVVLIVDYGEVSAEEKKAFLMDHPAFAHIKAVQNDRFLTLSHDALTPGPRNVDAVEELATFLHGGVDGS